jgi:hypothetical protein
MVRNSRVDVDNAIKQSGSNLPTVISNKKNMVSITSRVMILISRPFMVNRYCSAP